MLRIPSHTRYVAVFRPSRIAAVPSTVCSVVMLVINASPLSSSNCRRSPCPPR